MARLVRWSALVAGVLFILTFTIAFVGFFNLMRPFGGIPWSWNFLLLNAQWVVLPVVGILLVGFAIYLFRRGNRQHRPNEEDEPRIV